LLGFAMGDTEDSGRSLGRMFGLLMAITMMNALLSVPLLGTALKWVGAQVLARVLIPFGIWLAQLVLIPIVTGGAVVGMFALASAMWAVLLPLGAIIFGIITLFSAIQMLHGVLAGGKSFEQAFEGSVLGKHFGGLGTEIGVALAGGSQKGKPGDDKLDAFAGTAAKATAPEGLTGINIPGFDFGSLSPEQAEQMAEFARAQHEGTSPGQRSLARLLTNALAAAAQAGAADAGNLESPGDETGRSE
jgi:hypothetical protein